MSHRYQWTRWTGEPQRSEEEEEEEDDLFAEICSPAAAAAAAAPADDDDEEEEDWRQPHSRAPRLLGNTCTCTDIYRLNVCILTVIGDS